MLSSFAQSSFSSKEQQLKPFGGGDWTFDFLFLPSVNNAAATVYLFKFVCGLGGRGGGSGREFQRKMESAIKFNQSDCLPVYITMLGNAAEEKVKMENFLVAENVRMELVSAKKATKTDRQNKCLQERY